MNIINEWLRSNLRLSFFTYVSIYVSSMCLCVYLQVVCDLVRQCSRVGELRSALESGAMKEEDVYAELGDVVNGDKVRTHACSTLMRTVHAFMDGWMHVMGICANVWCLLSRHDFVRLCTHTASSLFGFFFCTL